MKKPRQPEIYNGKTGVDLPVFQTVPLNPTVFASYTGPDGGLTQVCMYKKADSESVGQETGSQSGAGTRCECEILIINKTAYDMF